jgi:DNA-3-methyladenine glycosylase
MGPSMPGPASQGPGLSFFARPAPAVAADLIGALLTVHGVGGTIVETEAYERDDPASHSYKGPSARNAAMFGPPGRAYVYRSYGIHWCLNVVCGLGVTGSAVLIRALEPTAGIEIMQARRGRAEPVELCRGPGRLCQALDVTGAMDGQPLDRPPFLLQPRPVSARIVAGPRIGITRGTDTPWRFGMAGSTFLSRPFPAR